MVMDASWEEHQSVRRNERRQAFMARLQEVIADVHAAERIDDIILGVSRDACALFGCDRMTLYVVNPCRTSIKSRIKIGMDGFKDFSLPITTSSIAGFVAMHKRSFNIRDVYDAEELASYSSELRFLDAVDRRTGYRSREMVASPIVNARNGELLGVLQLINNRMGGPFPDIIEEGARKLCRALAVAFEIRMKEPAAITTRFDPLVVLGHLAAPELELAKRSARRKQMSLEDVLLDEFQVDIEALGAAYAHFFGVPYDSFREGRSGSPLLQDIRREYAENNGWVIVENTDSWLAVAAIDPDRLRANRVVENLFPGHEVELRVTTDREFRRTVEQVYGANAGTTPVCPDQALTERIHAIVAGALAGATDVQAVLRTESTRLLRGEGVVTLSIEIKV